MQKLKFTVFLFLLLAAGQSVAQSRATIEAYIERFKTVAMAEMQRTGVPAAITLAQGIHETGAGTSDLVVKSNNHFGIKCKTEWEGERVYHDDDARGECFRKYDDPLVSYRDHSDFLRTRPYYASLFTLDPTDYEAWALGLKKAGYATNPKYPQILIKLIRDYNLQDYTLIAMGRKPVDANEPQWTKASETVNTAAAPAEEVVVEKPFYPQGIFEINGTKVMFITRGTSYLKIATEQDLSLARLFDFNDMKDGDVAPQDGLLYLQRKRKTGTRPLHVVRSGETLYSIAQEEGIRLASLLELNFLTPNVQPAVGESLYLTASSPARPRLANEGPQLVRATFSLPVTKTDRYEPTETRRVVHTVEAKETMYSIARKYNVSVEDLMTWNDLDSTELKIGRQLRINQPAK